MNDARIRHFWEWFRQRANEVRKDPRRYADEIGEMIGRLDPGLAWEMGGPNGDGGWDFILRTETAEVRHVAHRVVGAAPTLSGWRISSWRLPSGESSFEIDLQEGRKYSVDRFTAEVTEDPRWPLLNLVVSSPDFRRKPTDKDKYAGYIALDTLLGEQLVEDALDTIDFRSGPEGAIAAPAFRVEVERKLEAVRRRATGGTASWMSGKGEREGKPIFISLAQDLGSARMPTHPWLVEVRVPVREPNDSGLPSKDELAELQDVGDRIDRHFAAEGRALLWGTWTHDGARTCGFYVSDPAGWAERAASVGRESGYDPDARIRYDSRWQVYRQYLPRSEPA